jgi:hypothetical protein
MQKSIKINYAALPDELKKLFIADGCKNLPMPLRSKWHDYQELRRKGNRRDFISNVWATPVGASDAPFDHTVLEEIKNRDIRDPDYRGELLIPQYSNGVINTESIQYIPGIMGRLQWWGNLPFGRPNQQHNYIIAVDPSYGLGSANSAILVYDRNTYEQVGMWADANTKPEKLVDIVVALAYWCGGIRPTYIIWDAGGGCGTMFTNRLVFHRYPYIYTQRREDSKTRKQMKKWGWIGNAKKKDDLLGELAVALSCGLIDGETEYKSIIIHDKDLLDELFDYVFREKGAGAVVSKKADLSTGALERHGDRVITAGLAVLACREQLIGKWEEAENPPINSFQARYNKVEEEQKKEKAGFEVRRYLF